MKKVGSVLILTREYAHPRLPHSGGTGIFYRTLAQELSSRGINVKVFGTSKKAVSFEEDSIQVHFIKDIFKDSPLLEFSRSVTGKSKALKSVHAKIYAAEKRSIATALHNFLKKNDIRPDIAETHDFDGLAVCIDENIPTIIRTHGSWSVLKEKFGYEKVHQGRIISEQEAFRKIKNVIAISDYSAAINAEIFNIPKPEVIYNGIDTSFFKNTGAKTLPYSVFYYGSVSVEKGALTALEAIKILKTKFPEVSLHYIGRNGDFQEVLKSRAKEFGLEEAVYYYGKTDQKKAVKLLSSAHAVIFPSKGENFGLALVEAMALQKPVVCSNLPAFSEIVQHGENGFIAGNAEDFASYITQIFENPELATKLALKARETVEQKFTVEKMVEDTLQYYQKIINS